MYSIVWIWKYRNRIILSNGIILSNEEKQKKILDICKQFLTVAYTYGFSKEDVIAELQNNNLNNK